MRDISLSKVDSGIGIVLGSLRMEANQGVCSVLVSISFVLIPGPVANRFLICSSFNIENHITMYPSNYRGRPVTEINIQDYISNIVSKYLPPDLPPWQICVIPMANATRLDDAASTNLSAAECGPSGSPSTSAGTVDVGEESAQHIETDSSFAMSVSVGFVYTFVRVSHVLPT